MPLLTSFIDGRYIPERADAERFETIDPATGEVLAEIQAATDTDVDNAVASARQGQQAWAALTPVERARILNRAVELLRAANHELAELESRDTGKPLSETRAVDIVTGADVIEYYAGLAVAIEGRQIPLRPTSFVYTRQEPLGVVAGIGAWNYPIQIAMWKSAPALAAGNAMIFKPSEVTPLSAPHLAEIFLEAGLPAGVFNVLTGSSRAIGGELTGNDTVKKFSFTGSTEVGRLLLAQCAGTVKKVSMELGGNAPFIVFDDADLDAAVTGALISKFRNAGQTCVCANRLYVQAGIHDRFVEKFTAALAELKVGNGLDAGVTFGPLIDENAIAKVQEHIADAVEKGGKVVAGGKPHALGGLFFEPTIVSHVTQQARVAREETFGPLAPIFRFETEEEVVRWANDTEFGLAAYFYTRDLGRSIRVAEALDYGMVAVNSGILSNEAAPFGGVKQSGLGREGSKYGIEDYVEVKYVLLGGIDG